MPDPVNPLSQPPTVSPPTAPAAEPAADPQPAKNQAVTLPTHPASLDDVPEAARQFYSVDQNGAPVLSIDDGGRAHRARAHQNSEIRALKDQLAELRAGLVPGQDPPVTLPAASPAPGTADPEPKSDAEALTAQRLKEMEKQIASQRQEMGRLRAAKTRQQATELLQGEQAAPLWGQIQPSAISEVLDDASRALTEVEGEQYFRIREGAEDQFLDAAGYLSYQKRTKAHRFRALGGTGAPPGGAGGGNGSEIRSVEELQKLPFKQKQEWIETHGGFDAVRRLPQTTPGG